MSKAFLILGTSVGDGCARPQGRRPTGGHTRVHPLEDMSGVRRERTSYLEIGFHAADALALILGALSLAVLLGVRFAR
jgi:hypothetical protein